MGPARAQPAADCAGPCPTPAARSAASQPRTIVTLGFDVATKDQERALPLLDKYGMKATFFVNSGLVNRPNHLSWDQLRHMQAEGHEIAGQTISHARLTDLSRAQMRREICDDRGRLLAQGLAADAFAYPFGAFNRRARSIVINCGYTSARLASGIAGAGKKCPGCPFAETIPPRNPFATRMVAGVQRNSSLARLKDNVRDAKRTGGGWVQMLFHHVCRRCHRYAVTRQTLDRFLRFLAAEPGVDVRTVSQLMDYDGPSVRVRSATRRVRERATFRARPSAPAGVRRVRFFVDGRQVGIRNFAPWRLRFFTHGLAPGEHKLRALLEDRHGNAAISPQATFLKPAH